MSWQSYLCSRHFKNGSPCRSACTALRPFVHLSLHTAILDPTSCVATTIFSVCVAPSSLHHVVEDCCWAKTSSKRASADDLTYATLSEGPVWISIKVEGSEAHSEVLTNTVRMHVLTRVHSLTT